VKHGYLSGLRPGILDGMEAKLRNYKIVDENVKIKLLMSQFSQKFRDFGRLRQMILHCEPILFPTGP
jgi:uncharacterized protein YigE (DUF2233 family)